MFGNEQEFYASPPTCHFIWGFSSIRGAGRTEKRRGKNLEKGTFLGPHRGVREHPPPENF